MAFGASVKADISHSDRNRGNDRREQAEKYKTRISDGRVER